MMSDSVAHVSAQVYLLRRDEGGRKLPVKTGYRPTLYFGQQQIDGIVSFESDAKPVLGREYVVTIRLINPEHLGGALKKDAVFDWREGSKIVARGTVLDIQS
jgi:elongation factor Tu